MSTTTRARGAATPASTSASTSTSPRHTIPSALSWPESVAADKMRREALAASPVVRAALSSEQLALLLRPSPLQGAFDASDAVVLAAARAILDAPDLSPLSKAAWVATAIAVWNEGRTRPHHGEEEEEDSDADEDSDSDADLDAPPLTLAPEDRHPLGGPTDAALERAVECMATARALLAYFFGPTAVGREEEEQRQRQRQRLCSSTNKITTTTTTTITTTADVVVYLSMDLAFYAGMAVMATLQAAARRARPPPPALRRAVTVELPLFLVAVLPHPTPPAPPHTDRRALLHSAASNAVFCVAWLAEGGTVAAAAAGLAAPSSSASSSSSPASSSSSLAAAAAAAAASAAALDLAQALTAAALARCAPSYDPFLPNPIGAALAALGCADCAPEADDNSSNSNVLAMAERLALAWDVGPYEPASPTDVDVVMPGLGARWAAAAAARATLELLLAARSTLATARDAKAAQLAIGALSVGVLLWPGFEMTPPLPQKQQQKKTAAAKGAGGGRLNNNDDDDDDNKGATRNLRRLPHTAATTTTAAAAPAQAYSDEWHGLAITKHSQMLQAVTLAARDGADLFDGALAAAAAAAAAAAKAATAAAATTAVAAAATTAAASPLSHPLPPPPPPQLVLATRSHTILSLAARVAASSAKRRLGAVGAGSSNKGLLLKTSDALASDSLRVALPDRLVNALVEAAQRSTILGNDASPSSSSSPVDAAATAATAAPLCVYRELDARLEALAGGALVEPPALLPRQVEVFHGSTIASCLLAKIEGARELSRLAVALLRALATAAAAPANCRPSQPSPSHVLLANDARAMAEGAAWMSRWRLLAPWADEWDRARTVAHLLSSRATVERRVDGLLARHCLETLRPAAPALERAVREEQQQQGRRQQARGGEGEGPGPLERRCRPLLDLFLLVGSTATPDAAAAAGSSAPPAPTTTMTLEQLDPALSLEEIEDLVQLARLQAEIAAAAAASSGEGGGSSRGDPLSLLQQQKRLAGCSSQRDSLLQQKRRVCGSVACPSHTLPVAARSKGPQRLCASCGVTPFCSSDCIAKAWRYHRIYCPLLKRAKGEAEGRKEKQKTGAKGGERKASGKGKKETSGGGGGKEETR